MKPIDLNRRQALQWTAAAFGSGALAACGSSQSVNANTPSFVYAMTNATQNSILTLSRDPVSGILTQGSTTVTGGLGSTGKPAAGVLGALAPNSYASQFGLSLSSDNSLMFAANPGDNSVSVFGVNASTGALTLKKNNPLNVNSANTVFPNSLAYNKANSVLYATFAIGVTSADNHLAAYSLAADGTLTALGAGVNLGTNAAPTQVLLDPSGKYLVINGGPGTDKLFTVALTANGGLGTVTTVQLPNATPFNPFAASFYNANGVTNYLLTSIANQAVYALPWNASTGAFMNKAGTLQPSGVAYSYQGGACWSFITPNANLLLIGNGAGSVSTFALNVDGNPSLLNATAASGIGVGGDLWVSPDSKFLYVNDLANAKVLAYSIGTNGSLTSVGTAISVGTYPQGLVGF